jgi:hypothetical protein
MFLRLTLVAVAFFAATAWTRVQAVPMALAFVGLFTLLSGLQLIRFAQGRSPLVPTIHAE